jgi:uncharacterized protein (DUF1330 family)
MTVYALAVLDITDRSTYAAYEQGFMAIFAPHGGAILSVEEAPIVKEGDWPHTRTVLISFPTAEALDAWFHSDAYQALAKHRHAAASGAVIVLQGLPGAGG